MAPPTPVYVLGVGMTKFIKPRGQVDYPALGLEACTKALADAHITYDECDAAVACYCYGDSTCGQRVLYQLGMTQIPIHNVNNNCSTGSTGLALGRSLIAAGGTGGGGASGERKGTDCVLVVGFEKMMPGSLKGKWEDRASPLGGVVAMMAETRGVTGAPGAAQMFGNAGLEYMEK